MSHFGLEDAEQALRGSVDRVNSNRPIRPAPPVLCAGVASLGRIS